MKMCISHFGTPEEHEIRVHNSTDKELAEVRMLPYLAFFVNDWRQRNISIYADPANPEYVYTVGTSYSDCERVVTHEPRREFAAQIEYYEKNGKPYVYR